MLQIRLIFTHKFLRFCSRACPLFILFVTGTFFPQLVRADDDQDQTTVTKIDPAISSLLGNYLNTSFRIHETLSLNLDGSDKASSIDQQSEITNDVVFYSPDEIRVRRELPFSQSMKEFLKAGDTVYVGTPAGQLNLNQFDYSDSIWAEIVLSPLRIATQWSLTNGKSSLQDWLKKLKHASNSTQKNVDGDEIVGTFKDKSIEISAHGKLIEDGNTQVLISEDWQLTSLGKVAEDDLKKSLIRSN